MANNLMNLVNGYMSSNLSKNNQNLSGTTDTARNYDMSDKEREASDMAARSGIISALSATRAAQEKARYLNQFTEATKKNLKANYNDSLKTLKKDYEYSQGNINSNAEDSLKQAYINNMMGQRNLQQKLASQGINGGATESTVARLVNAYGNNRNNIDTQRNKDLSALENTYTQNKSKALQDYNTLLSQLEQNYLNQKFQIGDQYDDRIYQAIADYGASASSNPAVYNALISNVAGSTGQVSPAYYLQYMMNGGY